MLLSQDVPISSWCCFNKGHINLQMATETDSYLPGQTIHVHAQVKHTHTQQALLLSTKTLSYGMAYGVQGSVVPAMGWPSKWHMPP